MSRIHAVVLAAGAGRRFGGGKLSAPFRGGRLIDAALAVAAASPVDTVVLVTGAEAAAVTTRAAGHARVSVVHAADHAEGMAASLRAGIAALPLDAEGALVFLGDMPDVPIEIAPRLIAALAGGAEAAVPMAEGRRGHPVAFSKSLFPALLALRGDQGARAVLDALGPRLAEIATADSGVLADIDTPDQLKALDAQ